MKKPHTRTLTPNHPHTPAKWCFGNVVNDRNEKKNNKQTHLLLTFIIFSSISLSVGRPKQSLNEQIIEIELFSVFF